MSYQAKAAMLYADAITIFKTIVGVDVSDKSPQEIRKIYIAWIKENHPDVGGNETQVALVNAAHDKLREGRPAGASPSYHDHEDKGKGVRTEYIYMINRNGDLEGSVLKGKFDGILLRSMLRRELFELMEEIKTGKDAQGLKLLEAYMNQIHPGWEPQYRQYQQDHKPPPKGDLYVFWAWKGTFTGGMTESDISREFSMVFHKFEKLDDEALLAILSEFHVKNRIRSTDIKELFAGKVGTNILYRMIGGGNTLYPPYKEYKVGNIENHPTDLILKMYGLAADPHGGEVQVDPYTNMEMAYTRYMGSFSAFDREYLIDAWNTIAADYGLPTAINIAQVIRYKTSLDQRSGHA
jgi:hypothetical protein